MFYKTAMVEVSDVPDIMRIQGEIAGQIGLSLHEVDNPGQRAVKLYTQLTSEKDKKTLIILDNMWKKLNLDEVGIPSTCKLLLTTRDREVCRVMGVHDVNTLEAGLLNMNEAKHLFKSEAGDKVDIYVGDYKNVVDRLLSKCGGLPLAIVATANALKDKDLPSWQKFACDLEKPISNEGCGDHRKTYSILDTSYKFIESEEKRMFFLLACLSPIGSSVSIESLMRYGIGLDFFQHVNKLSEAMAQANEWADELVSSSMLLRGDLEGYVKIHDVVRAFGISFAAKDEGHKFIVEAIPRWLNDKGFRKFTAISLLSANDCYSRLDAVEAGKLQILLLKGDLSLGLPDSFFEGMTNLEVLALSNMNFRPSLPESIQKLTKLRSLFLENCKLGDLKLISVLVNLLVLSLRESFMEDPPNDVGALCNLRLLDLTGYETKQPLFAATFLDRLLKLEGLYMPYYLEAPMITEVQSNEEGTSNGVGVTEFNRLHYLNALELHVQDENLLPDDAPFVKNLDNFRIHIGEVESFLDVNFLSFHGVLDINGCEILEKSYLKALLRKADWLRLDKVGFRNLVPDLNEDGFRELRFLEVSYCEDVTYIVNAPWANGLLTAFPNLRTLKLVSLPNLNMLCGGETRPGMFAKLEVLSLKYLDDLQYVLPLALLPHNLTEIEVCSCVSVDSIFIETSSHSSDGGLGVKEETDVLELPLLSALRLSYMRNLISLFGLDNYSDMSSDDLPEHQVFFNTKVTFPSLKVLQMSACTAVEKLWSKEFGTSGFQNLREMSISHCNEMSAIGSHSVFAALVRLESLQVWCCDKLHEVITEETEELEISDKTIIFPQLKNLELEGSSNLESFYRGRYKIEFPKLTKLVLDCLGRMCRFASGSENSSVFFSEKVDFACLEELEVADVNEEVKGLWNLSTLDCDISSNQVPILRKLKIGGTLGLRHIPHVVSNNLACLKLEEFNSGKILFSCTPAEEGFVWLYSQLSALEELWVSYCRSLEKLFEDCHAAAAVTFCAQLRLLSLCGLPELDHIRLEMFKGLCSLHISNLSWEYLISADELFRLQDSLQQLEDLHIENCRNMKVIILEGAEANDDLVVKFRCLKEIQLSGLGIATQFFASRNATLHVPLLKSISIKDCNDFEQFWSGPLIAPRLEDVQLDECRKMQYFIVNDPHQIVELPSLSNVNIYLCLSMLSFSSGPMTAPRLHSLSLSVCDKMVSFFSVDANQDVLVLSLLETVIIERCHSLRSLSAGKLRASKLDAVIYNGKGYSGLDIDDLNHFLRTGGRSYTD